MTERIFIVGFPRSGTTLVQSRLAAHPDVASFPESHFFATLQASRPLWQALGLARRHPLPLVQSFYDYLVGEGAPLPRGLRVRTRARSFLGILDRLAADRGKSVWVEKTPRHLYHLDLIAKVSPGAGHLHVVRNPLDAIVSLWKVRRDYPAEWSGAWSIEQCAARWVQDIRITRHRVGTERTAVIVYDELVRDPEIALRRMCARLRLPFRSEMLQLERSNVENLVMKWEGWKARNISTAEGGLDGSRKSAALDQEQREQLERAMDQSGAREEWAHLQRQLAAAG